MKHGDKLLGLIGVLSGTSMLHEDHCQSHATLEPTLLQVRVSNSIQTRIIHESWANLPFKRKILEYFFFHIFDFLCFISWVPEKNGGFCVCVL